MKQIRTFLLGLLALVALAQIPHDSLAATQACPNLGYFSSYSGLNSAHAASAVPACTQAVTGDQGPVWSNGTAWIAFTATTWTQSSIPAAAAAVGYNNLTFSSTLLGPASGSVQGWYAWNLYGETQTLSQVATQNSDGSITLTGFEQSGAGQSVATLHSNSGSPQGMAFGGGFYVEFTLSFTNPSNYSFSNGGPAVWMLDADHFYPGTGGLGHATWGSDSGVVTSFDEVDVMEYDAANSSHPYAYQVNWTEWEHVANPGAYSGGTYCSGQTANSGDSYTISCSPTRSYTEAVGGSVGSINPSGTPDYTQPHKYGLLWVPSTGNGQTTTSTGYLKAYFDGVQVSPPSGSSTTTWNYHSNTVGTYPSFPPVLGDSEMSNIDFNHMFFIMGSDATHVMSIQSVKVWQASAANNITFN